MTDYLYLIYVIYSLISIITMHEMGHYAVHWWNKRQPKLYYLAVTYNIEPYNQDQLDSATFAGIVWGLMAFPFLKGIIPLWEIMILLAAYIYSCRDDLRQLGKKYEGLEVFEAIK
jgi:hypothetical protein